MRVIIVAGFAVIALGLALLSRAPGLATLAAAPVPAASAARGASLKLWSESDRRYVVLSPVTHTDAEWRALLPAKSYTVARQAGTEMAFTGATWNEHRHGIYRCVACGTDLFKSDAKFESGTGWPSFWAPVAPENVELRTDGALLMERTEVLCRRCGSHLGHVFDDGPPPTGKRYCMNSAALQFVPQP